MLKKKEFFILSLLAFIILFIKNFDVINIDVSWQYFASKYLTEGLMIYKDYNVVSTPLFYILNSFMLKINPSIEMFRLSVILMSLFFYITLLLIIKNVVKKYYLIISVFFIAFNFLADYNILLASFYNLGVLIFLKMYDDNNKINCKNTFLLSVLCVLMVLCKHTMGGILTIGFFIMLIILTTKTTKKAKPIIVFCFSGTCQALLLLFILYRLNLLEPFIENCFYGVLRFSNNVNIIDYSKNNITNYILLLFVLFIVTFLLAILDKKTKQIYLTCFCVFQILFIYPIANEYHIFIIYPLLLVTLYSLIIEYIQNINEKTILKYGTIIFICIITISQIIDKTEIKYDKQEIINYIEENKEDCNFYSPEAIYAQYCIETKQDADKDLYIYLYGNCGQRDYIDIIKEFEYKGNNNYMYLYNDEEEVFWQTPLEGREYIINHYQKVEELEYFDIYKIP